MTATKVAVHQIQLVPSFSNVGGDAFYVSHRVVALMESRDGTSLIPPYVTPPHLNWPHFVLTEAKPVPVIATSRHVTRAVTGLTVRFYLGCSTYCVLIGRSHGEPGRFTDARFRWNEVRWGEVRGDESEMSDVISVFPRIVIYILKLIDHLRATRWTPPDYR